MRLLICLLLAAVVAKPPAAYAFGWDGHHMVCAVAWDELTPDLRAKVEDILEAKGRDAFALSCRWADDVIRWRKETAPWHYINAPQGETKVDMKRDCPQPNSCVVEQVSCHAARLKSPSAKDDLRYTAHFIGDLHTPLHVGYEADRGGNDIKGKFEGIDTNLHAVWDYNMLDATHKPWPELADELHGQITDAERKQWQAGTPVDWANESFAITLSPAMGYHRYDPPFDLGEAYAKTNLPTVYQQIKKAGVRLAWVLTQVLK